jgi:hypothetical protein
MRHGTFISKVALAAMVAATVSASNAWAQSVTTEKQTVNAPAPPATTVQTTTPVAAAPAQPVAQAVPVQTSPVSSSNKTVVAETHHENYMLTVAKSVFFGAVAGALVGSAIYFIGGREAKPVSIGYWTAGGALVGVAAGLVEVAVNESRTEQAVSSIMEQKDSHPRGIAFVPRLVNLRF